MNDSSVKREIMEVVITRPSKPPPPRYRTDSYISRPASASTATLVNDTSITSTVKEEENERHRKELQLLMSDEMPIRSSNTADSSTTLPPPPPPLAPIFVSSSGEGPSTLPENNTPHPHPHPHPPPPVSYMISRALDILLDAGRRNTLQYSFSSSSLILSHY